MVRRMISVRSFKVSVTQEDIQKGVPGDSARCPIHRALRRAVGGEDGWNLLVENMPLEVIQFVRRFDAGLAVEPFTFTALIVRGDHQVWDRRSVR